MTMQARPTTYRGIAMRSRLEARVAAELDNEQAIWHYEPRAYASPAGQYLPDFVVVGDDSGLYEQPVVMEVRPTLERAYLAMDRMSIVWDSEPDARLVIYVPDVIYFIAWPSDRTWRLVARRAD